MIVVAWASQDPERTAAGRTPKRVSSLCGAVGERWWSVLTPKRRWRRLSPCKRWPKSSVQQGTGLVRRAKYVVIRHFHLRYRRLIRPLPISSFGWGGQDGPVGRAIGGVKEEVDVERTLD
ncbi:hypothetical protein CFAM422_012022 [Trichoderma lentiforme]|uniref:Uncharacterized protein n=1 Tax=Trichoderma lentiforme TaxID=1567552 RepID=A0A9P4X4R8_9HYPO|nr:hypothetical protein CFAM422_012022 [Trichoderma lentiforme]